MAYFMFYDLYGQRHKNFCLSLHSCEEEKCFALVPGTTVCPYKFWDRGDNTQHQTPMTCRREPGIHCYTEVPDLTNVLKLGTSDRILGLDGCTRVSHREGSAQHLAGLRTSPRLTSHGRTASWQRFPWSVSPSTGVIILRKQNLDVVGIRTSAGFNLRRKIVDEHWK